MRPCLGGPQVLHRECAGRRLGWAERVFFLLDEPGSCRASVWAAKAILLLIVASSLGFILATEPAFQVPATRAAADPVSGAGGPADDDGAPPEPAGAFAVVEAACILVFTAEYLARALTVWPARSCALP